MENRLLKQQPMVTGERRKSKDEKNREHRPVYNERGERMNEWIVDKGEGGRNKVE